MVMRGRCVSSWASPPAVPRTSLLDWSVRSLPSFGASRSSSKTVRVPAARSLPPWLRRRRPDVKERMYAISFDPAPTSPEEYDQILRKQLEMFCRVAKEIGMIPK